MEFYFSEINIKFVLNSRWLHKIHDTQTHRYFNSLSFLRVYPKLGVILKFYQIYLIY